MFALAALLFLAPALQNGIRLVEIPAEGGKLEIVAGYTSGGLKGFSSSEGARNLTHAVYAAGGTFDFFEELDRTGVRISAPAWSLPMLVQPLARLFSAPLTPARPPFPSDFRGMVEDEIRNAIAGNGAEPAGSSTDDAFVLISANSAALKEQLEAIARRPRTTRREDAFVRLPAERTLRFKSAESTGAVIFASPVPGIHYRQWYLVLLLDRLIRRVVPISLSTSLPLTLHPYYYRIELAVPSGQFPETAEGNLLQEIQRLQFAPATAEQLQAARQEALAYLDSRQVREWFLSNDVPERRDEGKQWIESMTADDVRATARDLLLMNRVIATWPPKPRQTSVQIESLGDQGPTSDRGQGVRPPVETLSPITGQTPVFPPHAHEQTSVPLPERPPAGALRGNVSSGDLPALFILKTMLDLKIIQAGWWRDVQLRISADVGSTLQIRADERSVGSDNTMRAQILAWIREIGSAKPDDAYYAWVREVAIHHLDDARKDLQLLIWERDPLGAIPDLETISSSHVQDVAKIYF